MINVFNSYLWIIITLFVMISSIYLLFYYNFTNYKVLKNVKLNSKKSIKILNISLASKIGVGSISGVAISIIIGGMGTVFWIWVSTFFLSIFTYLETKSSFLFRENDEDNYICGPFVYIEKKLNNKKLSTIYLFLILFTYLFSFILIQSNTIIISLSNVLLLNKKIILLLLIIIVYISINNDIERISKITSYIVPIMGVLYLLIGLFIIIKNINIIPSLFVIIIKNAFNIKSTISIPFIIGFQRSIFSNETGMGSTSMILSLSESKDYKQDYFFQFIGMLFISLVVCTISALIILTSNYESISIFNLNGIEIINYSFNYHFNKYGPFISSIIITLFAYSTIITSFYYGNLAFKKIFNYKKNTIIKIIVIIVLILSIFINPKKIWNIVDISTGFTTIINIYSLIRIRKYLKEG